MPLVSIAGADDPKSGVMYSVRDEPPSHYTLEFDQFSLVPKILLEKKLDKHESKEFKAGGYNWNLSLYPEGDKTRGGADHLSLYLGLSKNNSSLKPGWKLDVVFTLFVYNHNDNNYITVQGSDDKYWSIFLYITRDGKVWRLHEVRRECGFAKLLTLPAFNDLANGYLDRDRCAFGVEVFTIKSLGKAERLFITEDPDDAAISFTIPNFYGSKETTTRDSALQTVAGLEWRIRVYQNGSWAAKGTHISVYLRLGDAASVLKGKKVLVKYSLSFIDQLHRKHVVRHYTKWFSESAVTWGTAEFMLMSLHKDEKNGYMVKGTSKVEAKITFISEISDA